MDLTVRSINEEQRHNELGVESDSLGLNPSMNGNNKTNDRQVDKLKNDSTSPSSEQAVVFSHYKYLSTTPSFHGMQCAELNQSSSQSSIVQQSDLKPQGKQDYLAAPELTSTTSSALLDYHPQPEPSVNTAKYENVERNPSGQILDEVGQPVRRPMNAFMIWSREKRQQMAKQFPKMHNAEISKHLGTEWRAMTDGEKKPFLERAKELRTEHMRKYPNYRYTPRRKVKSQSKITSDMKLPAAIIEQHHPYPYLYRPVLYSAGFPNAAVATTQSPMATYPRFPQYLPQYYPGFGSPYTAQQRHPSAYLWNQSMMYATPPYTAPFHNGGQLPRRCGSTSSSYSSTSNYSYPSSLSSSPTFDQQQQQQQQQQPGSPAPSVGQQSQPISPITDDTTNTSITENDLGEMINIYLPENDV